MTTGIICAYVHTKYTGTCTIPLIKLSFWNYQSVMQCILKCSHRHTTGAICTIHCQIITLCTRSDYHAILCCNLYQCFSNCDSILPAYLFSFWKIPLYLFINIYKTDHTCPGISAQRCRHFLEFRQMPFHRVCSIDQDWIISPPDTVYPH